MAKNKKPTFGEQIQTLIPTEEISFDVEEFDNLIRSQGVTLVHYRAMRNPIGMTDPNDIHHTAEEDFSHEVDNGFIYKKAGEVTVFFQTNQQKPDIITEGILDTATSLVTVPRYYDNCNDPVVLVPFDRFFMKDCEARVVTWQTVETSSTGIDRLQYKAFEVEHLIDANGREYRDGKDFKVVKGDIKWLSSGKQPGYDAKKERGTVYVVRYRYQPHWYVKELVHEIRMAQVTNPATYDRNLVRLPYTAILQREYAFINARRKKNQENESERDARGPDDDINLGPR